MNDKLHIKVLYQNFTWAKRGKSWNKQIITLQNMKAKHTEAPNCLIKQPVNKLAAT